MLSFKHQDGAIHIALDSAGIAEFITILQRLDATRGHVHLLTKSNGGRELDEKTPRGEEAVGEVIVDYIE